MHDSVAPSFSWSRALTSRSVREDEADGGSGNCPSARFQLFFCIQRQLDHALEQLIGGQSREVLEHQLLDVESHQVAQLQRAIACREHKVAMPTVDHDDVALGVETAAP